MNTTPLISILPAAIRKFEAAAATLQSPVLLLIRLFWGWQFFVTGKGKLGDIPRTAAFFDELSIPLPTANAVLAGTTECVGGLLLMLGLASRLTTLPLIATMVVAYLTADLEAVKGIFLDPDSFTSAAPFLFLFACVLILAFGPGKFSADHFLSRRCRED